MSNKEKYNGWTNYATWRVNLEFFDGLDAYELRDNIEGLTLYDVARYARDSVQDFVDETLPDDDNGGQLTAVGMLAGWVRAFLEDVEWREIAEHLAEHAGVDPTQ